MEEKRSANGTPEPVDKEAAELKLRQDAPVGILRVEGSTKPRRIPSDLRLLVQGEPSSPQPSVDRLSVTFAEDSIKSDSSTRVNLFNTSVSPSIMEKVHFPTVTDAEDSEEEDYSASVNAIIQRKASQRRSRRRSKRRASSPYSPDILPGSQGRRRSSVYTTSSGDTAITVDDAPALELTQEQIFENIRLHKEVLTNVKMQPWNMRRKLKLVMQAKSYVKRHEGALQQRFTQTHSLRNILARWNIYLIKKWQHYRREMANISNWLIPWERRIKEIESHFGSVVASYFIFLRWLFWVNLVISVVLLAFVVLPEIIITARDSDPDRKEILPEDKYNSTNFLTLWDFEGVFKYTPLFYGWYTNRDFLTGYRLPLAYFITQLIVYVYSFVATLRKMAVNSRMSKLSEKDDESIFTWKVFTGWDYMIGNPETAQNRAMSIIMGFKEALLEEAEKKRKARNWRVIWRRVFVNIAILGLFALSAAAVVEVVRRSTEPEANSSIWRRNETSVVMTFISFVFPMILEFLGFMEQYHPRKQLRMQLARIMLLNLLNLYSLIFAQFDKINDMTIELSKFKTNGTVIPTEVPIIINDFESSIPSTIKMNIEPQIICRTVCYTISGNDKNEEELPLANLIASVTTTIATTAFPKLWTALNATATNLTNSKPTLPYFNTDSIDNSTLSYWNSSDCFENSTDVNITSSDEFPLVFNSFLENFQDYLSYILSNIDLYNDTLTNFTETTTEYYDTTTEFTKSSYSILKTTMATVLNTTIQEITNNYEDEFTTFYDEVSTTISTLSEQCDEVCESFTSSYVNLETSTTIAITNSEYIQDNSYIVRSKLRSLCWETMFGQELIKLTVMDTVFTVAGTIGMDFFRGVFVRVMNRCWCWDLEKKFPEYGEFKVAENILHLVHNQGMVWMGMFFAPGLIAINVGKLILLMYLRSWAVLTCNVPHSVVFRASRSNNFYFALLLTMLFLCVLPVGFAIVGVEPSWHCGPFSHYNRIYDILTKSVKRVVPQQLHKALDYIVSPGIVIPILVLLILIIYYLISLTGALREANADLKIQLRQERTEERRKMFQIADRRRRTGSGGSGGLENTPFAKWKKLIHSLPTAKSTDESLHKATTPSEGDREKEMHRAREIVLKFLRRRMKKSNNDVKHEDEGTDNEQAESLPEDVSKHGQGLIPQDSIDSSDDKRVHILENTSDLKRPGQSQSVDKKRDEWSEHYRSSSPSRSNSSKETRQNSISSSNWSDNIPVITISKTESSESVLDDNANSSWRAGTSESRSKIKYVLKKQSEVTVEDESEDGQGSDDSTKTTVKSIKFDKSSLSGNSDIKTDSSF
ncbi:hypothetical protein RN001_009709 [Aquatica leii]|uniref:TMC domain-containing protein n=1 Tax=Aquatica leii TaxID=1421715 RepID=A0AAN7QGQ4_9COLE|nr:hypothetical protein RN001_009709 [Aquatica leii]